MERRTLLLISSVLVAALGTALIWLYVQGADQRAAQGQELVEVYVAAAPAAANTPASAVLQSAVPRKFSRESLGNQEGLYVLSKQDVGAGLLSTQPISPGLPLLRSQFSAAGGAPQPNVQLAPNRLAIQVQLADPQRVAGVLQPGSHVAIFAAVQNLRDKEAPPVAIAVLSKVKVLAAEGATARPAAQAPAGSTAEVPKSSVTLEVTQEQAKKLVLAQTQGGSVNTLWFALRGGDRAVVTPGIEGAVPMADLLNGDGGE